MRPSPGLRCQTNHSIRTRPCPNTRPLFTPQCPAAGQPPSANPATPIRLLFYAPLVHVARHSNPLHSRLCDPGQPQLHPSSPLMPWTHHKDSSPSPPAFAHAPHPTSPLSPCHSPPPLHWSHPHPPSRSPPAPPHPTRPPTRPQRSSLLPRTKTDPSAHTENPWLASRLCLPLAQYQPSHHPIYHSASLSPSRTISNSLPCFTSLARTPRWDHSRATLNPGHGHPHTGKAAAPSPPPSDEEPGPGHCALSAAAPIIAQDSRTDFASENPRPSNL
jgi:hypothetical protein